jgi:hypothetical protein
VESSGVMERGCRSEVVFGGGEGYFWIRYGELEVKVVTQYTTEDT